MTWRRLALFLAVVLGAGIGGCDGGSSGTGITTVQGNVANVDLPAGRFAGAADHPVSMRGTGDGAAAASQNPGSLGGIRVSIEGTEISAETDSRGIFRVRGDYDSEVTILFSRAADDLMARLNVNVPAGGILTMTDVQIDAARGSVVPARQGVEFAGLISAVDCEAETLVLVSAQKPDDGDQYIVLLTGSSIRTQSGEPVPCSALAGGDSVEARAVVNDDGTFGEAEIVVEADS